MQQGWKMASKKPENLKSPKFRVFYFFGETIQIMFNFIFWFLVMICEFCYNLYKII